MENLDTEISISKNIEKDDNSELSIIIENIEFTLIYKTVTHETGIYEPIYKLPPVTDELSRIVKIKSVNLDSRNEEFFWVYLSLSELGVWRFLCYDRPTSTRYDKGKEYVQSTCINMNLQQHIHLCYDRLDEIVSPHEDIIDNMRSQPGFVSITSQNINLSQKYISKHTLILHSSKREKYLIDPKTIPIKCGMTPNISEENVINQIQTTSKYLENNYIILHQEEIFRYNFLFRDVINSENIMMKVILKNKNTDETIILFYKKIIFYKLNVKITNKEQVKYNVNINMITNSGNEHFVVILVIPSTSHCLNNSLYSEYIHLGIYVCKPFDYTKYLNSKTSECTKDYSYIGYRYKNIFPIKNIENDSLSSIIDEPATISLKKDIIGGKKKRKSMKYKKSKKSRKSRKSMKYKKSIKTKKI